jgi:hypothetical protein
MSENYTPLTSSSPHAMNAADIKSKKKYIIDNIKNMNRDIKLKILDITIVQIDNFVGEHVTKFDAMADALTNGLLVQCPNGLNINLDLLGENAIRQIYDVIYYRMEILNTPVRQRSYPIFNFGETN